MSEVTLVTDKVLMAWKEPSFIGMAVAHSPCASALTPVATSILIGPSLSRQDLNSS